MRNHIYLIIILICFFIACSAGLSAQSGIGLFSRHLLGPGGEVSLGISERSSFDFLGAGLEYRLDRETHRLYSFIIGFSLQKKEGQGYDAPIGAFLQANWRLFKPVINKEKLKGFFSIGPRLFYLTQRFNPRDGSNDFAISLRRTGVEGQVAFNLDYKLSETLTLIGFINGISFVYSITSQEVENPILTPRQRRNSGIDIDGRLFNELRIGVMYTFGG